MAEDMVSESFARNAACYMLGYGYVACVAQPSCAAQAVREVDWDQFSLRRKSLPAVSCRFQERKTCTTLREMS